MTYEQIAQIAKDLERSNIHYTLIDFARAVLQAASAAPAQEPVSDILESRESCQHAFEDDIDCGGHSYRRCRLCGEHR